MNTSLLPSTGCGAWFCSGADAETKVLDQEAAQARSQRNGAARQAVVLSVAVLALVTELRAEAEYDVSSIFPVDVRFNSTFSQDVGESRLFTADTRALGSGPSGASSGFTLDTRSDAVPNVQISGRVFTIGVGLPGATVAAFKNGLLVGNAITAADGSYALSALPADGYELHATLAGYTSGIRLLVLSDATARQEFTLVPIPALPATLPTPGPIPPEQQPRSLHVSGAQLKVFDGSDWVAGEAVDAKKMTIVLTHGWVRCHAASAGIAGWPKHMAAFLWAKHVQDRANIVAWDWYDDAKACVVPPVDNTTGQGLALGQTLYQTLRADYSKEVHFLGHSLGALVNATAANYLHGDLPDKPGMPWDFRHTQMTIFDDAELAVAFGQEGRTGWGAATFSTRGLGLPIQLSAGALGYTLAVIDDWRNPIPSRSAWADNYLSIIGVTQGGAVNVCLQAAADFFDVSDPLHWPDNLAAIHGYPMPWYEGTIVQPSQTFMGFAVSFESGVRLPPLGSRFRSGSVYVQAGSLADPYPLRLIPDEDFTQVQQEFLNRLGGNLWASVVDGTTKTIDVLGDAAVEVTEAVTDWVKDAARDVWMIGNQAGLRLRLRTTAVSGGLSHVRRKSGGTGSGAPAGLWMEVDVPVNAVFLTFDFTVSGDGQNDSIVCGVNGTNAFSLQTKFVSVNAPTSSSLMDVSPYAGGPVQLFFGVLGSTSTDCTVTVNNIRFLALGPPALSATQMGNQCVVAWPASAQGFILESTSDLSQIGSWSVVTNVPVVVGLQNVITNEISNDSRFYRLFKQ